MKNVIAAIMVKDNLIFIAKRKANDTMANRWEFPGGKIEKGESPEECLKREMKEELDIEVSVGEFFAKSVYRYENGTINLMAYWTTWISGKIVLHDHDEYKWVAIDELKEYDFLPADIPLIDKLSDPKMLNFTKKVTS